MEGNRCKIKAASNTEQSGIVNTADVEFISVWLRGNYANSLRENKKDSEDKDYELLGEKFHDWVRINAKNRMGLKKSIDFKEFVLKEMSQIADVYLRLKKYAQTCTDGFESVFYNFNRDLNYQTLLIISAIDRNDSQDVIDQKIKLVAKFVDIFASNRILNGKKANFNTNKVTLFKVLVNIRNQSVKELAMILTKALMAAQVEWDKFETLSYENQFFKRYALHFLARFTSYINEQMGNPSEFATYVNRKSRHPYDIEHILPDAHADYKKEFPDEKEFQSERNKIGDLLILTADKNRSYQDLTYENKVTRYMGDNILAKAMNHTAYCNNPHLLPLAKKYGIKHYDTINKAVIAERARMYLSIAKDIWDIAAIKENVGGWTDEAFDAIKYDTVRNIINHDDGTQGETVWVIAGNTEYYDLIDALNHTDEIEWQQHANFAIGDTIYIYLTSPHAEIAYKCRVEKTDIEESERTVDDSKYYKRDSLAHRGKYIKMKLVKSYPHGSLTLETMKEKGVKATFQGPTKATGILFTLLKELDEKA